MTPPEHKQPPRHFSMFRQFHLADVLTIGNAASGTLAIFAAITFVASHARGYFFAAASLIFIALIFDVLDGRVARWRQQQSLLGQELDSLADGISFGVAPAVLAFVAGINHILDVMILLYFVACGISRLARFNVTAAELSAGGPKVKYFEGTPIPTSVILVAFLAYSVGTRPWGVAPLLGTVSFGILSFHPAALLFALSGSLMISKRLHIPKW